VAEVPQHERPDVPGQPGDLRDVGQRAGAVADLGEDDDGDPLVQRLGQHRQVQAGVEVRVDLADRHAAGRRHPGHDVAVGREVVGAADQHVPAGAGVGPGDQQLVQVHARRVGDQHLTGPGAEDAGGQHVTDPAGLLHPAGQEPTSPRPHSCSTTRATAAGVSTGSRPSELPSR
jgi:hypothetical protein